MNKRIKAYIFSGMFLAMLVLPRILFIPLKGYVDTKNYENRVYQEKPVLSIQGISQYPGFTMLILTTIWLLRTLLWHL